MRNLSLKIRASILSLVAACTFIAACNNDKPADNQRSVPVDSSKVMSEPESTPNETPGPPQETTDEKSAPAFNRNYQRIADASEFIFVGKVESKKSYWNKERTLILTDKHYRVSEVLKGPIKRGDAHTVTEVGGQVGNIIQSFSDPVPMPDAETHIDEKTDQTLVFAKREMGIFGQSVGGPAGTLPIRGGRITNILESSESEGLSEVSLDQIKKAVQAGGTP